MEEQRRNGSSSTNEDLLRGVWLVPYLSGLSNITGKKWICKCRLGTDIRNQDDCITAASAHLFLSHSHTKAIAMLQVCKEKGSMIKEELPEENVIFKVSLSSLSNLGNKEISLMRDQIFPTIRISDSQEFWCYEPKDLQSQESDPQSTEKLKDKTPKLEHITCFSATLGYAHLWGEAANPQPVSNHLS